MTPTRQTPTGTCQEPCRPRHDSPAQAAGQPVRRLAGSAFVAAALAFVVLNLACWGARVGQVAPAHFPELTWTGWTIQDFLSLKKRPDVVFLGSSLVLVPVAGVDADYLGKRLDGSIHHRSVYFQDAFRRKTGLDVSTFNFGLPGEMPSDAYLITDFLLRGEKRPKVLVYGVGPRDFMDNLLPSPASTDPFRNVARFGDIGPFLSRVMPDWLDRLNFRFERLCYLYGHKGDATAQLGRNLAAAMDGLVPPPAGTKEFTIFDRRQLLPAYRPVQLARGEAYFRPTTPETRARFLDNIEEYRKRYRKVKWDMFVTQMEFLADTIDVARSRGVRVVIVSMPITDENRQLIRDYAWDAYRRSVKTLATAKGATYVDMQGSGAFTAPDFGDTVHLHSGGGKKWLDLLVDRLASEASVVAALGGGAGVAEGRGKGANANSPAAASSQRQPLAGLRQASY